MSLRRDKIPIDYDFLRSASEPYVANVLSDMGVTHIFDIYLFRKNMGYKPSISSVFVYGQGGSYDFTSKKYGHVVIYNGTISSIECFRNGELKAADQAYRDKLRGV